MLLKRQFEKDKEELFNNAVEKLTERTEITNFSPGGLARSFLDIYSDELDETYDMLTNSMVMSFVSQAEGVFLDEIGKLVDCHRRDGENEENYRYRIIKQNQTLATANETAIRLACLSVDNVNDIYFKDYLRGVGTFEVYVISDTPNTPQYVLDDVEDKIQQFQAKGNDGKVLKPTVITIDMEITLIFYEGVSNEIERETTYEVRNRIEEYINNQKMGGELIIKRLIERIMSSDEAHDGKVLKNVQLNNIYIEDEMTFIRDMDFYWDERPAIRNLTIN